MKLAEHLKAIERFVLDHKPPSEIRTHLRLLEEHLEADDSLLDQIAKNDANHAAVVATMSAEKAKVDKELADMKAKHAKEITALQKQIADLEQQQSKANERLPQPGLSHNF